MMRLIKTDRNPRYRLTLAARLALCVMALGLLPSVKAQEAGKHVSIHARIAALEAKLNSLKREVAGEAHAVPDKGHRKKPKLTGDLVLTAGTSTVTLEQGNKFSATVSLSADDTSLGSHQARISTPGPQKQHYDVFEIDTSKLKKPGLLVIRVKLGDGDAAASFDLFPGNVKIPTDPEKQEKVRVKQSVASLYDVPAGHTGSLIYHFKPGDTFKLGATGNWFSEEGATNTAEIEALGMDFKSTIDHSHGQAGHPVHFHSSGISGATLNLDVGSGSADVSVSDF